MITKSTVLGFLLLVISLGSELVSASEKIGTLQGNGVVNVTAIEANQLISLKPNLIILDIRTPQEFRQGHIKGAVNIDFYAKNFASLASNLEPGAEYLVHCRSGRRSSSAMPTFLSAGMKNLSHMNKGFLSWQAAGLKTVRN